jgi:biopolymer transport protein ExbD
MIAAPSVYQSALKVKLPMGSQSSQVKHVTVQIFLTAQGEIQVDHKRIQAEAIETLIKKALKLDPSADAMIAADHQISHGKVIEIIDAIKKAGIKEVALATQDQKS